MDLELTRIGRLLFGRSARLVLAAWVHGREDPVFYQSQAVQGTSLPQSNVREELERLVELGMLGSLPRDPGSRRQYYARQEANPLWAVIEAAVAAATDTIVDSGSSRSSR